MTNRGKLYCNRERLITLVFSSVRDVAEPWPERLRWLLGGELAAGFGFRSGVSRRDDRALDFLAGYVGRETVELLASGWYGTMLTRRCPAVHNTTGRADMPTTMGSR